MVVLAALRAKYPEMLWGIATATTKDGQPAHTNKLTIWGEISQGQRGASVAFAAFAPKFAAWSAYAVVQMPGEQDLCAPTNGFLPSALAAAELLWRQPFWQEALQKVKALLH